MMTYLFVRWLVFGGVIVAALGGAYVYVKGIGYDQCKSEWFWALKEEAKDGEAARKDAESSVARDVPDVVRRDPRNRDNWKQ
jgi:hypothetical protein